MLMMFDMGYNVDEDDVGDEGNGDERAIVITYYQSIFNKQ